MLIRTSYIWYMTLAGVFLAGCDGAGGPEAAPKEEIKPAVQTAERGPVKMTVTAHKSEITLAERLRLTVEVVAEEGVEIEMPQFADRMTDFSIHDLREWDAEPVAGGRRWRQDYELDVFLSGEYTIPEATCMFTDARGGEDSVIEGGVTTDEFTVRVVSLLEGEFDPAQFNDIKGPVALPMERTWVWAWWTAGGLAGLAAAILLVILILRRVRRERPARVIPAHEWALNQLRTLADRRLVENGMVHEFYFRLSMIVREYIERRFELTAPEWTTEEFLVEAQRSLKLPAEYRPMLGGFMRACDLVKFALYEPGAEEIEQVFNAARDFVEQSAGNGRRQVAA